MQDHGGQKRRRNDSAASAMCAAGSAGLLFSMLFAYRGNERVWRVEGVERAESEARGEGCQLSTCIQSGLDDESLPRMIILDSDSVCQQAVLPAGLLLAQERILVRRRSR